MRAAAALVLTLLTAACNDADSTPGDDDASLTPEEIRVAAMQLVQAGAAAELDVFDATGAFTEAPEDLPASEVYVATSGLGEPGRVSLAVCGEGAIIVLGTESAEGSVFAVKARGDGILAHYIQDPVCDDTDGPKEWPNGYRVTRRGLMRGSEVLDAAIG